MTGLMDPLFWTTGLIFWVTIAVALVGRMLYATVVLWHELYGLRAAGKDRDPIPLWRAWWFFFCIGRSRG